MKFKAIYHLAPNFTAQEFSPDVLQTIQARWNVQSHLPKCPPHLKRVNRLTVESFKSGSVNRDTQRPPEGSTDEGGPQHPFPLCLRPMPQCRWHNCLPSPLFPPPSSQWSHALFTGGRLMFAHPHLTMVTSECQKKDNFKCQCQQIFL
jgi:hypothetical protein